MRVREGGLRGWLRGYVREGVRRCAIDGIIDGIREGVGGFDESHIAVTYSVVKVRRWAERV